MKRESDGSVPDPRLPDSCLEELTRRDALGSALALAGISVAGPALAHPSNEGRAGDISTSIRTAQATNQDGAQVFDAPQGANAVPRTFTQKFRDFPLALEDFGAVGDGVQDDTAAFGAAVAEATRRNNATIQLSGGKTYRIEGTIRIGQGIAIRGPGSQGSTSGFGCTIRHHGTGDLFVWDGSGKPFAGTGGGLRDVLITKAAGRRGGCAIRIVATDDSHRPGEMFFENVLIYGEQEGSRIGLWEHALVIDGTRCDHSGARGVRSTRWSGCRFASTTSEGRTVILRQVSHAYFVACAMDTGTGSPAGLYLEGHNDNVHFSAAGLAGALTIAENSPANSLLNFTFIGKIGGTFVNEDSTATGALIAVFDEPGNFVLVNKSKALKTLTNIDPDYKVALSKDLLLDVPLQQERGIAWTRQIFDVGSTILPPFDQFICAAAGRYEFRAVLNLMRVSPRDGALTLALVHRPRDGVRAAVTRSHWFSNLPADAPISIDIASTFELSYGDKVGVVVSTGAKSAQLRILGTNGDTLNSWFEGCKR